MKIIKQGRTPEEELYRGICFYCDTEIGCEQRELTAQDDGRNGLHWWVKCPHCNDFLDHRIFCEKVE